MKDDKLILVIIIVNIIFFTFIIVSITDKKKQNEQTPYIETKESEGIIKCVSVVNSTTKDTSIKDINNMEITFKDNVVKGYTINYHLSYENEQGRDQFNILKDIYIKTIKTYRNIESAKINNYFYEGNTFIVTINRTLTEKDLDGPLFHYNQDINDALKEASQKGYVCR